MHDITCHRRGRTHNGLRTVAATTHTNVTTCFNTTSHRKSSIMPMLGLEHPETSAGSTRYAIWVNICATETRHSAKFQAIVLMVTVIEASERVEGGFCADVVH
ncbi:hypothetical protein TcasGA2_TC013298 [Tribolium castaneum]|uniref:Uncharacterized protein n=1 Tax=Tribolium castaneum TaxID=7070 RepID=D6WP66_TRICA|nr:hypothetical protein TcasGA2_TC013298 [Tribolium castaneum]